jgi:putative heme-binding domain-containing protein
MRSGQVSPGTLDTARRERLLHHPDPAIAALAVKLFETANPDRKKVIDAYQPALKLSGDAAKGKAIFAKTCAACHQLEKVGHAIGPDLAVLKTKTPAYLLGEILDPNRNLDSRYMQYTAILADGRSLIGLLASETAAGILLKAVEGKEYSILRRDLEALKSSGKSLMPDGLETDLPPQAMADLIAYLTSIKP